MASNKIGFSDTDIRKAINGLNNLTIERRDINAAASKALIPAAKEAKAHISRFRGSETKGVSISLLLAKMVRRRQNTKTSYDPGARLVIDGPSIPMGDREWNAQGVAKLFQKSTTGQRITRKSGANRGTFEGRKVGGGENYLAAAASKVEATTKKLFETQILAQMRKQINKAVNGN